MVFILFDFILNIPVNKFPVMSAHSTKLKILWPREGVAEGPDPLPGKSKTLGLFSNIGPDPLEKSKATKPAFNIGIIIAPPAVCCWADDGPLLVVFWFLTIYSKKVCQSLVGLRLTKLLDLRMIKR